MKRAIFALASLALSGCFLDQHKPNPVTNSASGSVEGIVAIEDVKGPTTGAMFMAMFARAADTTSRISRVTARPEQSQCKLKRKPLAATAGLISVGQLSFGTALQSTHLLVEENDKHQYTRTLNPDFPAGTYHVAAAGVTGLPGFQAYLQVPESLQDVSVNGQAFGSSSVLLRKTDTLVASWRQPAVPNADQVVILDIETKTATESITLHCIGIEGSFAAAGGSYVWQIPAQHLADLPETKSALVYFVRAIVKDEKSSYLNLQIQGLRTWFTEAEVGG